METKTLTSSNKGARFPQVKLAEPLPSGFVHIAAEVDPRPPFLPNSRKKRQLIACCKQWCRRLEGESEVLGAVVFDVFVATPGRGEFLERRPGEVHVARFDLAVLIETTSPETAEALRSSPVYTTMERTIREEATFTHVITATNPRAWGRSTTRGKESSSSTTSSPTTPPRTSPCGSTRPAGSGRRPAWATRRCCSPATASAPSTTS